MVRNEDHISSVSCGGRPRPRRNPGSGFFRRPALPSYAVPMNKRAARVSKRLPRPTNPLARPMGLILLVLVAAFAADSPLVGVWQLESEHSGQAGLYLFTPTRYSMVLAATNRPDIADMNTATA